MANTSDQNTGLDLGDILSVVGGLTGGNNQTANTSGGGGGFLGGLLGKLFKDNFLITSKY
ncbi:MAG: hypothetical protein ACI8ZN_001200 [Bacteroidia bacterium]|jgi:hypothetical protein